MIKRSTVPPRLLILLLVTWAVLIIRIGAPFYGVDEANKIWMLASLRNWKHYGTEATGFMPIRNTEETTPEDFFYYTTHPPLIVWWPGVLSVPFGINELTMRFSILSLTTISVAACYVLVRRLYDERMAFWAAAFYALNPMILYSGRVPGYDIMAMLPTFLFAAVMVNWLRAPNRWRLLALMMIAWMSVWVDWAAIFLLSGLGLAVLILGKRTHRLGIIAIGAFAVLMLVGAYLYYETQWDGSIDSLISTGQWRSSSDSDARGTEPFTMPEFFAVLFVHTMVFVTPVTVLLAIIGTRPLLKHSSRTGIVIVAGLFLGGFVYHLVFRNASFLHIWYKVTLVPYIAIAAAAGWIYMRSAPGKRRTRAVIDSLAILSAIGAVALIFVLHRAGHRPWTDDIIDVINAQAEPGERFLTHLEGKDHLMPVSYYTFRNYVEGLSYAEAVAMTEGSGQRGLYIYCPERGDESIPGDIPDNPGEVIAAGECQLIIIEPT